ncbi:hypothetical protein AVEN_34573-1 [Araneus ventricosus]|uniref:Uncharacterized protein n=1 Tax=Araneus ventricosus TaxID=182803 RepID=A0A4Y2B2T8_ARAVE|nr:hypothetical protein AVEN_34573-1 [Araneus ventricosus]
MFVVKPHNDDVGRTRPAWHSGHMIDYGNGARCQMDSSANCWRAKTNDFQKQRRRRRGLETLFLRKGHLPLRVRQKSRLSDVKMSVQFHSWCKCRYILNS